MTPGAAFRQLRLAAGYSQVDVARRLRVTTTRVCTVEAGRSPLPARFSLFALTIAEKALINTSRAATTLAALTPTRPLLKEIR